VGLRPAPPRSQARESVKFSRAVDVYLRLKDLFEYNLLRVKK